MYIPKTRDSTLSTTFELLGMASCSVSSPFVTVVVHFWRDVVPIGQSVNRVAGEQDKSVELV